jgi:hypothetical protein
MKDLKDCILRCREGAKAPCVAIFLQTTVLLHVRGISTIMLVLFPKQFQKCFLREKPLAHAASWLHKIYIFFLKWPTWPFCYLFHAKFTRPCVQRRNFAHVVARRQRAAMCRVWSTWAYISKCARRRWRAMARVSAKTVATVRGPGSANVAPVV